MLNIILYPQHLRLDLREGTWKVWKFRSRTLKREEGVVLPRTPLVRMRAIHTGNARRREAGMTKESSHQSFASAIGVVELV